MRVACRTSDRTRNTQHVPRRHNLPHRLSHRLAHRLPLAATIEYFADAFADMAGALGIGAQAARDIRVEQGLFDAKDDGLGREQPRLCPHGFLEGIAAMLGGEGHQAEQG